MTTLAEAILEAADALGPIYRSLAQTGSDTTHIVDELLEAAPSALEHGTVWFLTGPNAGLTRSIQSQGSGSVTFAALGSGVAAGNAYAVSAQPRRLLVDAVNKALGDLGEITLKDDTMDTVAGTLEYTLPTGVSNVVKVCLLDLSYPDSEYQITRFEILNTGKLQLLDDPLAPYPIRLYYNTRHPQVVDDDDELMPGIVLERLKWEAAEQAYRITLITGNMPADDNPLMNLMNEAKDKVAATPRHYTFRMSSPIKLQGW